MPTLVSPDVGCHLQIGVDEVMGMSGIPLSSLPCEGSDHEPIKYVRTLTHSLVTSKT